MLAEWLGALEASSFVRMLRLSNWAYPAVNTLHIIGFALLFGAIVPLDLRLAGWRHDRANLADLSKLLLPVAIAGFVLAASAGLLLFVTDARAYASSPLFQAKLVLIAAAMGNALLLRRVKWRAADGDRRLGVAGVASISLWLGVIALGRWIAYA